MLRRICAIDSSHHRLSFMLSSLEILALKNVCSIWYSDNKLPLKVTQRQWHRALNHTRLCHLIYATRVFSIVSTVHDVGNSACVYRSARVTRSEFRHGVFVWRDSVKNFVQYYQKEDKALPDMLCLLVTSAARE